MITLKEFLERYPRPWKFDRTDPDGTGVIVDADGWPLVILKVDPDYADENPDAECPVFCPDDPGAGVDQDMWDEREALISVLLGEEDDDELVKYSQLHGEGDGDEQVE